MDKKIIDYPLKGDKVSEDVNKESSLYEEYLIGLMPMCVR